MADASAPQKPPVQAPPQPQAAPKQSAPNPDSTNENIILCMRAKFFWWIYLVLLAIVFIFMLGTLGAPRWAWQENSNDDVWEAGLTSITKSDFDQVDEDPFDDILDDGDTCDSDISIFDEWCDQIQTLLDGGAAFITFELITMIFLGLWALLLLLEICAKPLPVYLGYVPPIVTFFFHFLGFVCWAGVTEAKFEDSCDEISGDDKEDMCTGEGPALALFLFFVLLFMNAIFVVLWVMKGRGKPEDEKESGSASAYQEPAGQKPSHNPAGDTTNFANVPPPMQAAPAAQDLPERRPFDANRE